MNRFPKKLLAIVVCFFLLSLDHITVWAREAKERPLEPPAYMRELSRLVAATANDSDFGEIQLTIDEPEIEVDGETQLIDEDAYAVPYIDENGEAQIPAVIFDDVPDEVGAISPAELEEKGYDVQVNEMAGTITITEPYGLCRLIVKTADGKVRDNFDAVRELHVSNNRTVLQYADKAAAERAANRFAQEKDILFCEPDGFITACAASETTYKNWGTTAAGADQFMATLPDNLPQVTVAVIDTGADVNHPFLAGRIVGGGWDFVNDDDDPDDDHFHGTHCAGIIRDATPDNVKILPVKALDCGGTSTFSILSESITYAADSEAHILSMSFGGGHGELFTDAVSYALSKGKTLVASAGNNAFDLEYSPSYPACSPGVIAVAATDETDFPAYFSNYGTRIDLAAPGSNIVSSVPGGGFRALSGTSMACPLVAACAALLKSEDMTRTTDDLRELLHTHTRDAYTPGRDDHVGYGIVYLGAYTPLQSIYLSISHMELEQLESASVLPRKVPAFPTDSSVTFTSSDPSVVYVEENGRIHAACAGTATVTVCVAGTHSVSYTVTVKGGNTIRLSQAKFQGHMILKTGDGTAWIYGAPASVGCYNGSVDGSPFRLQSAPGEYVTDIDRILEDGFLKTDGTYWLTGLPGRATRARKVPVMAVKENGEPLMGVKASYRNLAFLDDGTVWYHVIWNDPIFTPLCTTDGKVLTGVIPTSQAHGIFTTQDGRAFRAKQFVQAHTSRTASNPAPFYAVPETDKDGAALRDVQKAGQNEVLYRDGTLVRREDNAVILTDIRDYYGVTDDTYSAAWKKDGTVWNVATGKQVMKADGTPLTDVLAVQDIGAGKNYNALCADGTVWAWGYNGNCSSEADYRNTHFLKSYGLLGIGWNDAKYYPYTSYFYDNPTVKPEDMQELKDHAETPYSYWSYGGASADAKSLDGVAKADPVPRARQVMIDDETPLTDVREMHGTYYVRSDDSVWASGTLRIFGYGSVLAEKAVYARPYTLFGQQIYWENTDGVSTDTFERVEKITVSKPHMVSTVGETFILTASVFPENTYEQNIKWQSSDLSVATVDGTGTVTAQGTGFAVIRAYSASNDKVWGECVLTVEENAPVLVEMRQYPVKRAFSTADVFSTAGGLLRVTYQNGQVRSLFISPDFCSGYDLTQIGEQTVAVRFLGSTFTYPITVTEAITVEPPQDQTVTYIAWEKYPAVRNGVAGGSFVVPDASIRVFHADGTSAVMLLAAEMCTGYDMQTPGIQAVTVTYEGFVLSYDLTLGPRLSWIRLPARTAALGDPLCVENAAFLVNRDDGSREEVALTPEMCTGYDPDQYGIQTVTAAYAGETLTFTVTVGAVVSIAVEQPPAIGCYYVKSDTKPNLSGGTLCVTFADGSTRIIPMTEAAMRYTPVTAGPGCDKQTVYLDYCGCTTSFTFCNIGSNMDNILQAQITKLPQKTVYKLGEVPYLYGGRIYVRLTNGAQGMLDMVNCTVQCNLPYQFTEPGEFIARITLGSQEVSFTVTVLDEQGNPETDNAEGENETNAHALSEDDAAQAEIVTALEVETLPAKRCYAVFRDTWPDVTGGTLRVTYADGTQTVIPMTEAAIRYTPVWAGANTETQPVYLDYGTYTASYTIYNINAHNAPIETAIITRMPDRAVFLVGEQRDLTGGRIYVRMTDGAEGEEDMDRFSLVYGLPWQFTETGVYPVSIRLGSTKNQIVLSFTVKVVEPQDFPLDPPAELPYDPADDPLVIPPYQLIWQRKPTKTVYCLGEPLDTTGGQYDAIHGIGTVPQTLDAEMCSGFDPMQPGWQTVTVTYSNWRWYDTAEQTATLTFDVFVTELMLENEVPEIEVGKCTRVIPTFTPISADNRTIIWTSSDDSIATVDKYGRVTGIAAGEVEIIAQIDGSEAVTSCTVTVNRLVNPPLPALQPADGVECRDGFILGLPAEMQAHDLAQWLTAQDGSVVAEEGAIGTGTVLRLLDVNRDVIAEYTVVIAGDLNGDGMVNSTDVTDLRCVNARLHDLEPGTAAFLAADVNGDGMLNSSDVTTLRMMAAKLI